MIPSLALGQGLQNGANAFNNQGNGFNHGAYGTQYLGAGLDLFGAFANNNFDPNNASQFGQRRGGGIGSALGTGLGAALAPVTGGISIAVGQALGKSIGSLIGGRLAERRAAPILENREDKNNNFVSIYQDIARHRDISEQQRQGQVFINSSFQQNIPSL